LEEILIHFLPVGEELIMH